MNKIRAYILRFSKWLKVNEVKNRILVYFPKKYLLENRFETVGNYTARRDKPHFNGDEYHGHCEFGKYEVTWGESGVKRHLSKFPNVIPNDAKNAVAKVLKIDPSILEWSVVRNEYGDKIYLAEVKDK